MPSPASPSDPLDLLGTGVATPFRIGTTGPLSESGVPKVLKCVEQVIGTPTAKLPWRCLFGCRITRLRHMNNRNGLQQLARVDVANALALWEPRARLTGTAVAPRSNANRNILDVTVNVAISGKVAPVRLDV